MGPRGLPDAGDLREHPRVVGGHVAGSEAVDAEHVRGEVVRADREEVRGRGDLVHPRGRVRRLDHRPERRRGVGADGLDVGGVADQREQHADAIRGADRAQLRGERVRLVEQQGDARAR